MKKLSIIAALALATAVAPSIALAGPMHWEDDPALVRTGVTMSIPSPSTNMADTIGSVTGLGNAAGSIAAGANSALNPSGNSFIVPPPGAIGSVFVRPQH